MALKPAQGSVKIIDRASNPLKTISSAFKGLGNSSKNANSKLNKSQSSLDKLSRKLKRVDRSFQYAKKGMRGYISGFAKIASLGGILSTAGITASINEQAESLDKLGKKAGNLKMSTDLLQAMREQGKHAGMGIDEVDASMTRFTKRLGTFQATGSGLMAGVLKKINPALAMQLKGAKDNQEAYEMLLKTYAKLPTQQAKMALADAAFGQSGRKQLLMLDEGVQGLYNSRKKLMESGGLASREDIQAAADYNDTMQDLGVAIKSIKIKALTPIIQKVTKVATVFIEKFKNADYREQALEKVKRVANGLFKVVMFGVGALTFLSENLNEVVTGIAAFKIGMLGLNAVMAANPIGLIVSAIGLVVTGLVYAYTEFESFKNIVDSVGKFVLNVFDFMAQRVKNTFGFITDGINKIKNSSIGKFFGSIFGGNDKKEIVVNDNRIPNLQPNQLQPQSAIAQVRNNNINNNQANIYVNVADGKVKSIDNQGDFKTNVFLNNGVQQ